MVTGSLLGKALRRSFNCKLVSHYAKIYTILTNYKHKQLAAAFFFNAHKSSASSHIF